MVSTYRLKADELTSDFPTAVKSAYRHREIEITIQEVEDETEYLLSSPANRDQLLSAIRDLGNSTNFVKVPPDSFE
jgi:hypothetical protein